MVVLGDIQKFLAASENRYGIFHFFFRPGTFRERFTELPDNQCRYGIPPGGHDRASRRIPAVFFPYYSHRND
jgi:hypothetical protein